MKLALASKQDFSLMWKVHRALDMLKYCRTPLREQRLRQVIVGRLEQLGTGGFSRVVMGCELLIDNCCDKTSDFYDLSPQLKHAMQLAEDLQSNEAGSSEQPAKEGE
ncbi:hypothetical protein [Alteromonas macleodii]|uniref:Uncharacterized protein n=1 Tax=Alteromonas macleodii TaxID=28108 RepID=A0AB36FQL6_ALTMA|nr:hypothetical protein [Alteromonas macleodii]OES24145.1 hypothetical protein BFV93_4745 [Alteromonas macleodii]OES24779.1 hypothetical protein BFV95_4538 [Alteromonas macleodii]OES25057.1 hypothetical protein BFV94_4528 [Alteromonas macleodii]OES39100.1 hypothetical protein BFV96_4248 [Alteromonas macleodii]